MNDRHRLWSELEHDTGVEIPRDVVRAIESKPFEQLAEVSWQSELFSDVERIRDFNSRKKLLTDPGVCVLGWDLGVRRALVVRANSEARVQSAEVPRRGLPIENGTAVSIHDWIERRLGWVAAADVQKKELLGEIPRSEHLVVGEPTGIGKLVVALTAGKNQLLVHTGHRSTRVFVSTMLRAYQLDRTDLGRFVSAWIDSTPSVDALPRELVSTHRLQEVESEAEMLSWAREVKDTSLGGL